MDFQWVRQIQWLPERGDNAEILVEGVVLKSEKYKFFLNLKNCKTHPFIEQTDGRSRAKVFCVRLYANHDNIDISDAEPIFADPSENSDFKIKKKPIFTNLVISEISTHWQPTIWQET